MLPCSPRSSPVFGSVPVRRSAPLSWTRSQSVGQVCYCWSGARLRHSLTASITALKYPALSTAPAFHHTVVPPAPQTEARPQPPQPELVNYVTTTTKSGSPPENNCGGRRLPAHRAARGARPTNQSRRRQPAANQRAWDSRSEPPRGSICIATGRPAPCRLAVVGGRTALTGKKPAWTAGGH